MISQKTNDAANAMALKIVNLFARKRVRAEVAMHAMTLVMASILCDQDDVPDKIKALVHNLAVQEKRCRDQMNHTTH